MASMAASHLPYMHIAEVDSIGSPLAQWADTLSNIEFDFVSTLACYLVTIVTHVPCHDEGSEKRRQQQIKKKTLHADMT